MPNDAYEVVSLRPGFAVGAAGANERTTVVAFRSKTTAGTGEVEMTASDFTPGKVDAAIRAQLPAIDAIAAL